MTGGNSSNPSFCSSSSINECILVGLHTCGDLTPTMLRVFAENREVVGVISVGCCYMKLTTMEEGEKEDKEGGCVHDGTGNATHDSDSKLEATPTCSPRVPIGYPLSRYVKSLVGHKLSYEARELACHAFNSYRRKLQGLFWTGF